MDTVLGFATTRTTVGFVLVEGVQGDGATIHRDAFQVPTDGALTGCNAYKQVANRVWLGMRTIAASGNHRVRSVGVTWTDDADREAAMLLESLSDAGLDNVVPVELPAAGEALATAIRQKTAVCVVEPETVTAFEVDRDGAMKVGTHLRGSAEGLTRWLTETFDRDDRHARGLVVVGSDSDRDAITAQLKAALPVPILAPVQAQLALALGAARASAHNTEVADCQGAGEPGKPRFRHGRPWSVSHRPAVLLAGVLALVLSLSLGLGLRQVSEKPAEPAVPPQVANTSGVPVVQPVAPPVAPPVQQVEAPSAAPPAPVRPAKPRVSVEVPPPAGGVQPPASLPPDAPAGPVPQGPSGPLAPEPNQVPPAVPDPPYEGPVPPPKNCHLLCGVAI